MKELFWTKYPYQFPYFRMINTTKTSIEMLMTVMPTKSEERFITHS